MPPRARSRSPSPELSSMDMDSFSLEVTSGTGRLSTKAWAVDPAECAGEASESATLPPRGDAHAECWERGLNGGDLSGDSAIATEEFAGEEFAGDLGCGLAGPPEGAEDAWDATEATEPIEATERSFADASGDFSSARGGLLKSRNPVVVGATPTGALPGLLPPSRPTVVVGTAGVTGDTPSPVPAPGLLGNRPASRRSMRTTSSFTSSVSRETPMEPMELSPREISSAPLRSLATERLVGESEALSGGSCPGPPELVAPRKSFDPPIEGSSCFRFGLR